MNDKLNISVDFDLVDENRKDEAFASVNLNPTVAWAKFILTDDLPNANHQRVPQEEFENLIKTGVYMPIKMAAGEISTGHDGTFPIGVIAHLKKVNNQIHGLAALWERERPDDVELIRKYYSERMPLQLSWEILYTTSEVKEEVEDLKGTALRAVTLVGMPAYEGRTPIIAVAAVPQENPESTVSLEQPNQENTITEEELEKDELEAALAQKEEEIKNLKAMLEELESLRAFKADIEKERADASRLMSIRQKFSEAKLDKDDEYFSANKDMLLSLTDEALNFMVQELVSFASANASVKKDKKEIEIPNIVNNNDDDFSVSELAKELRNRRK